MKQKYILVTGGELFNKGAQAMTFITVDQIAKRFPEHKVILFSGRDYTRPDEEKQRYKFDILPFPGVGERFSLRTGLLKKRYLNRENGKNFAKYKKIFENSSALLDISGYALGSKWGDHVISGYIGRIALAKHFGIPVYLMPQSFGPFNFAGKRAKSHHRKLKRYLRYPKLIMAREEDGYESLQIRYNLKNVIRTPDLVLQNKEINLGNVYHDIEAREYFVEKQSVGIIPNSKNNKFGNKNSILEMYERVINTLLKLGKSVYLLYHAVEDLEICRAIKEKYFSGCAEVHIIEDELSCVEFDRMVTKFDFIIGSRFHSIVHAYRKAIPAVILGWAIKYRELAGCFGQEEYCLDVTDENSYNDILAKVEKMCANYNVESEHISAGLNDIQKESVYDLIEIKS